MELGLLVVRLAVGMLMMGHGAQKLFGSFGGHGPAGTGEFFESLGLSPGRQMAILAGVGELTGGALLALGLLTPLSAALLSAVLLTAAWTAHRAAGIWVTEGGYEYNLVLITGLFALAAVGPGDWSLDNALGIDANGAGWALAELGAAVIAAVGAVLIGRSAFGRVTPVTPAADARSGSPSSPSRSRPPRRSPRAPRGAWTLSGQRESSSGSRRGRDARPRPHRSSNRRSSSTATSSRGRPDDGSGRPTGSPPRCDPTARASSPSR